jgi:hypothetical protein
MVSDKQIQRGVMVPHRYEQHEQQESHMETAYRFHTVENTGTKNRRKKDCEENSVELSRVTLCVRHDPHTIAQVVIQQAPPSTMATERETMLSTSSPLSEKDRDHLQYHRNNLRRRLSAFTGLTAIVALMGQALELLLVCYRDHFVDCLLRSAETYPL